METIHEANECVSEVMSENPPPFNAESVLLDSVNVSSISVLTNSCEVDSSGDDCDESKWNRGKWINSGSEREDRVILSENCRRDMEVISSIMESQAVDLSFLKEVLRIFCEEDRREKDELLASLLQLVQEQNALLQVMKIPPTDLKGVDSINSALRVLREKTTLLHHSFSQPSKSTHQTLFRVVRIGVILIPLLAFLWLLIATPDSEVFYSFYVSQQTPEEYCYNYCCCSQD